ncbi:hypothetical protein Bca101_030740 [Brassica carinata]
MSALLRLPYLSKFIAQKIALQVRSFREFQELHLEERLQLLRGLLVCAIPPSPYHKEKGLWALLADSNNVWLFQKVSFMDGAEAILFFN